MHQLEVTEYFRSLIVEGYYIYPSLITEFFRNVLGSQYSSNTRNANLFSSTPPSAGTTNSAAEGSGADQERWQLIDTLIAPIIKIGKDLGYEIAEIYDLGAGPVHIVWTMKPGSVESLPEIRLGFICVTDYNESIINEMIGRAMLLT